MVKTETELKKTIRRFTLKLKKEICISKMILFGSYARGDPRPYSDIDIAVVSPDFDKMGEIEAMQFLSLRAKDIDLLIEPLSFPHKELKHLTNGTFLSFILQHGKIVYP